MRLIKISIIFVCIIFIFASFYISTLIYPYNTTLNSHFVANFKNINYTISESPQYSYIEFPTWTFTKTKENVTMLLTGDLKAKIYNTGSLSTGGENWSYFAFSKEPLEDGLYAIDEIYYHQLESIKGTKTGLFEIINFAKIDQTFLVSQEIYKFISILFFIIGLSIISLYILTDDLNSRGKLLSNQGNFNEATRLFKKILEIDPENESALLNIGYNFAITGKFEKANIYYDKAIELYPKSAIAWYNKGWSNHQNKDYENAIRYYKKAVELDNELDYAYYNLACVFSLKNDADNAIKFLKKAMDSSKPYYISKAKRDKDLDNIRDKPEFINLIHA